MTYPEQGDDSEEEFSLDDLGAAYARAMAESGMLPELPEEPENSSLNADADGAGAEFGDEEPVGADESAEETSGISPLSIVEAALFVGHPENRPLSAAQIAGTMRGVSAEEVDQIVDELNAIYEQDGHPFHIYKRDGGYWFGVNDAMRSVRAAFYGKVRETRLNQASIDVLALVAYQPGVTAAVISEQRGKDSSSIINQLVRRELLEMKRESRGGGKPVPSFYPTTRLLNLLGLRSLGDLPQVDEADVAPRL